VEISDYSIIDISNELVISFIAKREFYP
jgi:hypothetical protein